MVMKAIKQLLTTAFALILFSGAVEARNGWMDDVDKAFAKAKKENKAVMVEFTGSDWCHWCKVMEKQVFSKKSFNKEAAKNFILVSIDLPKGDKKLRAKNKPVVKKYGVKGWPTVILFGADGKEFNRFPGAQFQTVKKFLAHLNLELEKKDMD